MIFFSNSLPNVRSVLFLAFFAVTHTAVRADWSIQQMFDLMSQHQITDATIITHGFSLMDDGGGYMLPLAQAIQNEITSQTGQNVWLLDYDLTNDGNDGVFSMSTSNVPVGSPGQSGHAILLFDWGPESNEDSRWWAETAGDALFNLGTGLGIFDPRTQSSAKTQFIGHSFGTVTTTEAVERLAAYDIPVEQVTLLDPHDFDQVGVPHLTPLVANFDGEQRMFELGAPNGYGATIWENVNEADVYYQTRGNQGTAAAAATDDPGGRPVSGTYNRFLDGNEELPAGNPYGLGTSSDHGYVWNTFYAATVSGNLPVGGEPAAQQNFDYSSTGWAHSVHNQNRVVMPAPNFYSGDQDHEYSESYVVLANGNPNVSGLSALGLTAQDIIDGRWEALYKPGDVANGDFSGGERTSAFVDLVSGWSHHGGGGDSEINEESGNYFMRLDSNDYLRTHNYTYIPINAASLDFDIRVSNPSNDDWIDVQLGNSTLASYSLPNSTDWVSLSIPIPLAMRDSVETFGFELGFGSNIFDDPEIDIDNVSFDVLNPILGVTQSNGSVIDLGTVPFGDSISLSNALGVGNLGDTDSILDLIELEFEDPLLWSAAGFSELTSLMVGEPIYYFDFAFGGATLPGEYRADVTIHTNHLPATYELVVNVASPFSADFNNDGYVDYDDLDDPVNGLHSRFGNDLDGSHYLDWFRQFGSSVQQLNSALFIPEPNGLASVVVFSLLLLSRWFRFRVSPGNHLKLNEAI